MSRTDWEVQVIRFRCGETTSRKMDSLPYQCHKFFFELRYLGGCDFLSKGWHFNARFSPPRNIIPG